MPFWRNEFSKSFEKKFIVGEMYSRKLLKLKFSLEGIHESLTTA